MLELELEQLDLDSNLDFHATSTSRAVGRALSSTAGARPRLDAPWILPGPLLQLHLHPFFSATSAILVVEEPSLSIPTSPGRFRRADPCLALHGRPCDRASHLAPTASHAPTAASITVHPASVDVVTNPRVTSIAQQPGYPEPSLPSPDSSGKAPSQQPPPPPPLVLPPQIHSRAGSLPLRNLVSAVLKPGPPRPPSQPASRLWNPVNSTPRPKSSRQRRPSTPPPPSVPLARGALDPPTDTDEFGAKTDHRPLLTLPEQWQSKRSVSGRSSLLIEQSSDQSKRISLPSSVRLSFDGRSPVSSPTTAAHPPARAAASAELIHADKGKQAETMAQTHQENDTSFERDLESGQDVGNYRLSNASAGDGIGSAMSSTDSSIMGEDVQPGTGLDWGPQHPCYPHLNPHVPVDSLEYANTRIIRIRRDWLLHGDLAPTFSNLYPEILDPAGVSEQEFRRVIDKLNGELVPTFNPYGFRNILDGFLGLATGWLWDDFGLTGAKTRLNNLEKWIEQWNSEMEKTVASEEGVIAPKIIPLRQTGYMNLDIQIMNPEEAVPTSSHGANDSQTGLPQQPPTAIVV